MIGNERQYRITRARAEEFDKELSALKSETRHADPTWQKIQLDAVSAQLSDLRDELREYEAIRKRGVEAIEVNSFEELPRALIKGRIAAGITQKELAERLGMKEQQIQRYEATDYSSASLDRIREVIAGLDLRLGKGVLLPKEHVSLKTLIRRTGQLGLPHDFVKHRLLPVGGHRDIEGLNEEEEETIVLRTASRIERIYQVPTSLLLGDGQLGFPSAVVSEAHFKTPGRADRNKVGAYAVYAHYLSLLLLECMPHRSLKDVPTDPTRIYQEVLRISRHFSLAACLEYVWDLGIPVLPLREKGGFHGACWSLGGRGVIAIKQNTESEGRWIVDLFHELKHIGDSPKDADSAWIEEFDRSGKSDSTNEEQEVTDFAVDAVLGGDAEGLAQECARESAGRVQRLKSVVQKVAQRHNVRPDVLANYLAHRLEEEGQDWWGAAQNLQENSIDPWLVARDFLVEKIDWSALNPMDLDLLMQALA
ncbi:MAG: helix-turn-helix transcriptional regulator [Acidobacteria bacterium]|nr:helix-turn-helix transcriptional regulator [Acidobacteriota bacterium]